MKLLSYVHLRNIVNSTGAGRVARQMVESLDRIDGVDMRILADAADHTKFAVAAGDPWTRFDYRFFRRDTSSQQALWYVLRSPNAEAFWDETEIVYCTGESYVPVKKARLVVTMHDAAHFEQGAHARTAAQWRQWIKWRLLFGTLSRKADLFHTVSQFSADRLAHFFPALKDRLRVVHNAVSDVFFQPPKIDEEEYLRGQGVFGKRYVLVPGGLHYRKNAELIFAGWPALAAKFPDLLLVIINHSDPGYLARAAALGDRVLLPGYVPDPQLCAFYRAASVVWFPSRYEGFGLPVLEAMACAAPVVATDSSSIPEVAGDAAILLPPHDAGLHAEAIEWLLTNDSARMQQITKGYRRAAQFRWQDSARKLHREFQTLI